MQFHTQRRNMVIMVIFYGSVINTDMFFFYIEYSKTYLPLTLALSKLQKQNWLGLRRRRRERKTYW